MGAVLRSSRTKQELFHCAASATAARGKFSSARKRTSGRARENLLGAQNVARIGQAGDDIVERDTGIVVEDFGLAPAIGYQADDEFDGQPSAPDNRFAVENRRVERNARMLGRGS
jgi:hypothetical protein